MASLVSPADSQGFIVNTANPCLTEVRAVLLLASGRSGFLSKRCSMADSLHPVPALESNKSGRGWLGSLSSLSCSCVWMVILIFLVFISGS